MTQYERAEIYPEIPGGGAERPVHRHRVRQPADLAAPPAAGPAAGRGRADPPAAGEHGPHRPLLVVY